MHSTVERPIVPATDHPPGPTPQDRPTPTPAALRAAFASARAASAVRHRDLAAQLGVSEGALVAAHVGPWADSAPTAPATAQPAPASPLHAWRLRTDWPALLQGLQTVGEVMALTRNASCVHEKTGHYLNFSGGPQMGLVLGPDIDLRLFFNHWAQAFAVEEHTAQGLQRSLQCFDASGTAVHKVFARASTDLAAWQRLVQQQRDPVQTAGWLAGDAGATEPPRPAAEKPDAEVDVAAFRQAWAGLRDTHDFFGLLRRFGLGRTQALRLADPTFAQAVDPGSLRELLEAAAGEGTPIMVFTGNPGGIQIHTGPVHKVVVMGPWLNVLDPGFNLHLREDHIAQAWVVRKPTVDGLVTSLELFDAQGETIAMLFGERKPGRAELCAWRALTDRLVSTSGWVQEGQPCAHC
jgi:putative hemin transport protein